MTEMRVCECVRVCVRVKERKKEMFVKCVDERLYFENAFLAKRGSACVCMRERGRERERVRERERDQ